VAKQKNKAFTIIELVVAVGLLVMLVGLSSVVFSTTVKAHRKAMATIEITRNLCVLTDQLNADFRGLRKDAPLMFWFDSVVNGNVENRFDMTHFFADGDFQTVKQYNDGSDSKTISGNVARIFYGHANSTATPDFDTYQVLSRKSHILTADSDIFNVYKEIPLITDSVTGLIDYTPFDTSFGISKYNAANNYPDENLLEFNTITLTNWINALNYLDMPGSIPNNADHFIDECMDDDSRPYIDLTDYETLHLLMAQGVISFSVQWAYTPDDLTDTVADFTEGIRWWPSRDPDGDGDESDSDFGTQGMNISSDCFGVYLTLPNGTSATMADWFAIGSCETSGVFFSDTFYPAALKFTFRLKDSNNVFPDGKTFTHIVYLDN